MEGRDLRGALVVRRAIHRRAPRMVGLAKSAQKLVVRTGFGGSGVREYSRTLVGERVLWSGRSPNLSSFSSSVAHLACFHFPGVFMADVFLIIGMPGAGKSTFAKTLLPDSPSTFYATPVKHVSYNDGKVIYLGAHHPFFPGTDRLEPTAINKVIPWIKTLPRGTTVIVDGIRLANERFIVEARVSMVYFVDTDPDVASERRRIRDEMMKRAPMKASYMKRAPMKASYIKGCITQVRNLVQEVCPRLNVPITVIRG